VKLRLRHNSIRLRLTQSEVRQVRDEWRVEERIEFAPGAAALEYALVSSTEAVDVQAEWNGQALTVTAPQSLIEHWANSGEVTIAAEQPAGRTALKIVVEKDFQCLEDRGADDADAFPHPHAGAVC